MNSARKASILEKLAADGVGGITSANRKPVNYAQLGLRKTLNREATTPWEAGRGQHSGWKKEMGTQAYANKAKATQRLAKRQSTTMKRWPVGRRMPGVTLTPDNDAYMPRKTQVGRGTPGQQAAEKSLNMAKSKTKPAPLAPPKP